MIYKQSYRNATYSNKNRWSYLLEIAYMCVCWLKLEAFRKTRPIIICSFFYSLLILSIEASKKSLVSIRYEYIIGFPSLVVVNSFFFLLFLVCSVVCRLQTNGLKPLWICDWKRNEKMKKWNMKKNNNKIILISCTAIVVISVFPVWWRHFGISH